MKEFNKGQGNKRKIILFLMVLFLLLYGCTGNEINDKEVTENTVSTEDMAETSEDTQNEAVPEDTQETASDIDDDELSEEEIEWYLDMWKGRLVPIMTEEELVQLDNIDWAEGIRPYMEYDWISDKRIDRLDWGSNLWVMQLADLNLDGQPEMLVSEFFYSLDDFTHIYTVRDGEVVYCGKIFAGKMFNYNEFFGEVDYLLSNYIDVYQNDSGEFRYLSCEGKIMYDWGYYQFYESVYDGESFSCESIYAIDYATSSDRTMHYQYCLGDRHENLYNGVDDDENYATFSQVMREHMEGYEKVDINFTVCQYGVPTLAGALPEEQQEIVRNNILFGFAQALGYVDK